MDDKADIGFDWGAIADKGLDTIGKLLRMDAENERARLDRRLAETRLQAELWGIPSSPMNAQARAASYKAAPGGNNWIIPVLLIAGGVLLYKAM